MDVSVIIPAYNEELYIGETLRAVLAQNFQGSFEIIVVDNASTDATAAVAGKFPLVHVLREDQKGVQFAREKGRRSARGEILAYLDADCIAPRGWLGRGMQYFEQPNIVGISGPYDYYDAGWASRRFMLIIQVTLFRLIHIFSHIVLGKGGIMAGGNSLFRAGALAAVGGFDTSIRFWGDDIETARRLSTEGRIMWRPDMTVRTSARRFRKMGMHRVLFLYITNFIWVTFSGRPYSA